MQKVRPLPSIILNENPLPWVSAGVHLGNNFENVYNGLKKDIRMKRATFIGKQSQIALGLINSDVGV